MTSPLDPGSVTALVPAHEEAPGERLLDELRERVGSVLVVSDGMPDAALRTLRRRARRRLFSCWIARSARGRLATVPREHSWNG